jgi:hypothetical protein
MRFAARTVIWRTSFYVAQQISVSSSNPGAYNGTKIIRSGSPAPSQFQATHIDHQEKED